MRLLLIRHGPSAFPAPRGWVTRSAIESWREQYDAAGILADAQPPSEVVARVQRAVTVLASDMPRAIESAQRLAPDRAFDTHACLRELALRIPDASVRLPFMGWGTFIHASWMFDIARKREGLPAERARVHDAVQLCDTLAQSHAHDAEVAAVSHGVMRRSLAEALIARGWSKGPRRDGYAYWSTWELTSPHGHAGGRST